MSLAGFSSGGSSSVGPSRAWDSLPYNGYREQGTWLQEWVDAIGMALDIMYARFGSSQARANMLNPSYVPIEVPTDNLATAIAPPNLSTNIDTMLDVLCYIAGIPYPVDTHLSLDQKRALVIIGWDALVRKGTRVQIMRVAAALTDSIVYGWTSPPFRFDLILPDGAPGPGQGIWTPPSAAQSATQRPWLFGAIRALMEKRYFPAWGVLGIGYSQFRAGYSAAGEPVFQAGARLSITQNEHFSQVTSGVPNHWTVTACTILNGAAQTNYEFSQNVVSLDLTGQGLGYTDTLSQTGLTVNNQITHRAQIDYAYGNAQDVDVLAARIKDVTNNMYWNPVTSTWSAAAQNISLPQTSQTELGTIALTSGSPSVFGTSTKFDASWKGYRIVAQSGHVYTVSSVTDTTHLTLTANAAVSEQSTVERIMRARFAFDIIPQAASATTLGTAQLAVSIIAAADSTLTTQQRYWIYRFGVYEKFDQAVEEAAGGERTLWLPLVDAPGWSTTTRSSGSGTGLVEIANAQRTAYKVVSTTSAAYPYHPAISQRGLMTTRVSGWNNTVKGSNTFTGSDWTPTAATVTASAVQSPNEADVTTTAPLLSANAVGAKIQQQVSLSAINPASRSYVAGIWVKKVSSDSSPVVVSLVSGATLKSHSVVLTAAQGWQLIPLQATFGSGDTSNLNFQVAFGTLGTEQISLATAYAYDITARPGSVLYPPVAISAVGATATVGSGNCSVTTNSGSDVLSPLTLRTMQSAATGIMNMTVVPFTDLSPSGGFLCNSSNGSGNNAVVLALGSGVIRLELIDNVGNTVTASLTLTTNTSAQAGFATWKRDTAVQVRAVWIYDATSTVMTVILSAGNGNITASSAPGWNASEAGRDFIQIGSGFDGIITGVEVLQLGAPVT